jgi:uncharacterized protein (DUF924 family)
MNHTAILQFWFDELTPKQHFKKDEKLDALIRERFLLTHAAAVQAELFAWRESSEGRLAEIIVLDQFSRNLYRDGARAFAADGMALALAQEAVHAGADKALPAPRRAFLYMPYMHSESLRIHEIAVELFSQPGLEFNLKFEREHQVVIARFGRYPRRNIALGRRSTAAEAAFLEKHPAGF